MADIDLKTETPDTTLPTTGFLFGADSQAAASPSVFTVQSVATTLLGSTTLTGAAGLTADAPVLNLSQTWNNGAVTFTGLKFNATDTASASGSRLLELQQGGADRFFVKKNGGWFSRGSVTNTDFFGEPSTTLGFFLFGTGNGANPVFGFNWDAQVVIAASTSLAWSGSGGPTNARDLFLSRRGAANLRLGAADAAAPVAQTLSVQSGTAGASALTVSISGTALTIAGAITGTIAIGHAVTGTGVSAGTLITAGSGTSWTVNNSQTVGPITAYFNSVGQNLTITGSQGSGPSAGGSIIFQVAPAGTAATTAQNALATALTIDSARNATFAAIVTGASYQVGAGGVAAAGYGVNGNGATGLVWPTSGQCILWHNVNGGEGNVTLNAFGSGFGRDEAGNILSARQSSSLNTIALGLGTTLSWVASGNSRTGTPDLILARDDADKLALRRTTNAQAFNIYNTFTDASNYERGIVSWSQTANRFVIGAEAAGTGTARGVQLGTGSGFVSILTSSTARFDIYANQTVFYNTSGTERWRIDASGHFIAGADNTYDIGAENGSGTLNNSPRKVCSRQLVAGTSGIRINGGSNIGAQINQTGDGVLRISNWGITDFDRLQFGGTTSSFPALKRVSANLQVIAADGTSSAGLIVGNQALATAATDGFLYVPTCAGTPTGTPTAQTGTVPIVVDTTNNKLYFYSNAAWRDAGP